MPYMGGPPGHPMNHGPGGSNFPGGAVSPWVRVVHRSPSQGPGPGLWDLSPLITVHGRPQSPMPMGPVVLHLEVLLAATAGMHGGPAGPMTPVQDPSDPLSSSTTPSTTSTRSSSASPKTPIPTSSSSRSCKHTRKSNAHPQMSTLKSPFSSKTQRTSSMSSSSSFPIPSAGRAAQWGPLQHAGSGHHRPLAVPQALLLPVLCLLKAATDPAKDPMPLAGLKARASSIPGAQGAPSSGSRKKRSGANESGKPGSGKTKKSKHGHKAEQRTPPLRQEPLPASPTFAHPWSNAPCLRHRRHGRRRSDGSRTSRNRVNGPRLVSPKLRSLRLARSLSSIASRSTSTTAPPTSTFSSCSTLQPRYHRCQDPRRPRRFFIEQPRSSLSPSRVFAATIWVVTAGSTTRTPLSKTSLLPSVRGSTSVLARCYGASYRKLPAQVRSQPVLLRSRPQVLGVHNDGWGSAIRPGLPMVKASTAQEEPLEDALYRSEEEGTNTTTTSRPTSGPLRFLNLSPLVSSP